MRKLAFLSLGIYISLLFSFTSIAADSVTAVTKACPGNTSILDLTEVEITEINNNISTDEADTDLNSKRIQWEAAYSSSSSSAHCGQENGVYGVEKGDCSDEKFIITEISEPIGAATIDITSESLGSEGGVIDLYKGLCCLAGGTTTIDGSSQFVCLETRKLYYQKYDSCDTAANKCSKIQWIVASTGAGVIKNYVKQLYIFGAGIVGFVAVITMVYSGIQISVSGASGDITAAKERIIQSIMGIALLFFSGLILYTINPTFFN